MVPPKPSLHGPAGSREVDLSQAVCVSVRLLGLPCLGVQVPTAVLPGPPGPTPPDVLATWVGRSTLYRHHASHVRLSFSSSSSCWVSGRGRDSTDLDVAGAEERLLRAERPEGRGARKVPTQQPFDALNDCMHSFRRCSTNISCACYGGIPGGNKGGYPEGITTQDCFSRSAVCPRSKGLEAASYEVDGWSYTRHP